MANIRIPENYRESVDRSVFDLDRDKRSTIHCGVNIPIYFKKMYPGDSFNLRLASLIQSNPMLAPLMGRFKLRTSVFFEPLSNLYGWFDNNTGQSTDELLNRKHHTYKFGGNMAPDYGNRNTYYSPEYTPGRNPENPDHPDTTYRTPGIGRGGIFDYVGVAPGFVVPGDQMYGSEINIDKILAYLDIIRTYYVNRQEDTIPYISPNYQPVDGTWQDYFNFADFSLKNLDDLFMWLRQQPDGVQFPVQNVDEDSGPGALINYLSGSVFGPSSGLFCSMYEPDYFMNFLSNDVGKVKSMLVPTDQGISMHEVYFKNKLQRIIDRYDVSGGIFSNWLRSVWGVSTHKNMDIPDLIGSVSTMIDTSNITAVSNDVVSAEGQDSTYVGQLFGNVNQFDSKRNNPDKKFDFYVKAEEEGYCVVIVSLLPMPDYCENIEPDLLRLNFADDYKPQLSQLGFQDVQAGDFSVLPIVDSDGLLSDAGETTVDPDEVAPSEIVAKQVAWLDLMTDTNRVHGEFATFGYYDYWVLRRQFRKYAVQNDSWYGSRRTSSFDMSRYINPLDWQYMFTGTTLGDPNFFLQFSFDIKAVRPVSKRFMPSM